MFTGIIEEVGTVSELSYPAPGPESESRDAVLGIVAPALAPTLGSGQSISVDGICLTLTEDPAGEVFRVDVMPPTLQRTALRRLRRGCGVNLERAVPAGGRLDGHIVAGHVDGVAVLTERSSGARWEELTFAAPPHLLSYIADQGSVALAGVSLTVVTARSDSFDVGLIPHTLAHTALGALRVDEEVNLEVDVLAKYTKRLLATTDLARLVDPRGARQ